MLSIIKYLMPLPLMITQFGVGIFVFLKNRKNDVNVYFSFFVISAAFWNYCVFMVLDRTQSGVIFWDKAIMVFAAFMPAFFLFFTMVFPEKISSKLKNSDKFILFIPVIISLFFSPFFVKEVYLADTIPRAVFSFSYFLFGIYFISYFIWGIFNLIRKFLIATGRERTQLKYVSIGMILAIIFTVVTDFVLPLLGNARFFKWGPYFTLIGIAFSAYAIVKHRLMDILIVISRTLAYTFVSSLYVILYAVLIFVLNYFNANLLFKIIFGGLAVLFTGISFENLRVRIQTSTDKTFVKSWYDYKKVLRKAASGLAKALTKKDILNIVYPIFYDDIDISEVHIYFLDKNTLNYIEWDPATGEEKKLGVLSADEPLLQKVLIEEDIVAYKDKLCLPVLTSSEIVALFILGKKRSEDEYSGDDLELFRTITEYVSIALEYIIKPHEEVRQKFEETERKLIQTEKQLERSQRLASLGTLAAGVAHELRNPLGIIQAEIDMVAHEPRDLEYLKALRERVWKQIERSVNIIRGMLDLGRARKKRKIEVDINSSIESIMDLFNLSKVKLIMELNPVPNIIADPEEMKQVFINLIDNAIHAMQSGGELKIKTYQDVNCVYVEVADTGVGIEKEDVDKIFDPFYSTRHEGVGLGLSIVYRIITENNGTIMVTSEPGKGTTFTLKFLLNS